MERRRLLGVLTGLAAGVAGCSGREPSGPVTPPRSPTPTASPTPTPKPGVEVAGRNVRPGSDGTLVFVLELRNTADGPRQATYVVTVTAESVEFEATKRRTVEIPAGGTQTVEFTFDVSFDDWADGGGVDFQRANDAAE